MKKKKKNVIILVLEILVLLLVLGAAVVLLYTDRLMGSQDNGEAVIIPKENIRVNEDLPEDVIRRTEGYTTILIYGVDARNNKTFTKNTNADTDIICCINNETKEVKLVSILRDTFLETTGGKHRKLTDIYAEFGAQESIETINKCFDLNITDYVTVNWRAVADVINLLGGLDVELKSKEVRAINKYIDETMKSTKVASSHVEDAGDGVYHLDGIQCATYCRIRNVVVDNEGHDIGRAHRQRKVMTLALEKCKGMDFAQLKAAAETIMPGISTNLTVPEILGLMMDVADYRITDEGLFPFKYTDQENLRTAYVYCRSLKSNVTKLHEFLYGTVDYEPSQTVKNVSEFIDDYRKENP